MRLNAKTYDKVKRPVKVVQFGEGNFLRSFADRIIDEANEKELFNGSIVLVKPIKGGDVTAFKEQDCLYTSIIRGIENKQQVDTSRVITSIEDILDPYTEFDKYLELACNETLRFVISNTTEAGIAWNSNDKYSDQPADAFPAKLTQFMYKRFKHFEGDVQKGLILLPCELIEKNGSKLKEYILKYAAYWELEEAFLQWIEEANTFCNTLVDKIVPGYPGKQREEFEQKLGYVDSLMTTAEPFTFWAIETEEKIQEELPLDKLGNQVIFTKDMTAYRERKVRILNGAHTSMVCAAYLAGKDIVEECIKDQDMKSYIEEAVFEEIIPTLSLSKEELCQFADSVLERFENPFIRHELLSICLNTTSKWKVRVLPSLKGYYEQKRELPNVLTFSFAAYLAFYRNNTEVIDQRKRGEECYTIKDDQEVLEIFNSVSHLDNVAFIKAIASNTTLWGEDLTQYEDFVEVIGSHLASIETIGMEQTIKQLIGGR